MSSILCKRNAVLSNVLSLIAIILLQIATSRAQSAASGMNMCDVDCRAVYGPGYSCKGDGSGSYSCERRTCSRNCTGTLENLVCASNGITYRNRCELSLARCVENDDLTVLKKGQCMTLPPPSQQLCRKHQMQFDSMFTDLRQFAAYFETCIEALDPSNLTQLIECYRPDCFRDLYAVRQCHAGWCWCSDKHTGNGIYGTIKDINAMTQNDCVVQTTCTYEGKTYSDQILFTPQSKCGFCECDGNDPICYDDFVPDVDGQLSLEQLSQLKDTIMELFYFQRNHNSHDINTDLRHIGHLSNVSTTLKQIMLQWKFDHYDINGDDALSSSDHFIFRMDINELLKCKLFNDHLLDTIDSNDDAQISHDEWFEFFGVEGSSGSSELGQLQVKRSASL